VQGLGFVLTFKIYDNRIVLTGGRETLIRAVMVGVVRFQQATDAVDDAVAERLGVNRTDLRCLGVLAGRGPVSAGELAAAAELSPGATTTAVDRLARAGYVRRVRDRHDRRSVRVVATPLARERLAELYDPVGAAGRRVLEEYGDAELALFADFLRRGHDLQVEHAGRIRAAASSAETGGPA
jgi:DNA-binding MarR family transcriptional regulator